MPIARTVSHGIDVRPTHAESALCTSFQPGLSARQIRRHLHVQKIRRPSVLLSPRNPKANSEPARPAGRSCRLVAPRPRPVDRTKQRPLQVAGRKIPAPARGTRAAAFSCYQGLPDNAPRKTSPRRIACSAEPGSMSSCSKRSRISTARSCSTAWASAGPSTTWARSLPQCVR